MTKPTLEQEAILSRFRAHIDATHAQYPPEPGHPAVSLTVREAAALLGLSEQAARSRLRVMEETGLLHLMHANSWNSARYVAAYTLPEEQARAYSLSLLDADAKALHGTTLAELAASAHSALENLREAVEALTAEVYVHRQGGAQLKPRMLADIVRYAERWTGYVAEGHKIVLELED